MTVKEFADADPPVMLRLICKTFVGATGVGAGAGLGAGAGVVTATAGAGVVGAGDGFDAAVITEGATVCTDGWIVWMDVGVTED